MSSCSSYMSENLAEPPCSWKGQESLTFIQCPVTLQKKKVPAQHHLVSFTSDAEGCKLHFSLSMQVNNVYQMLEHPGNLSPTTKNIMSVKLTFGEEKK